MKRGANPAGIQRHAVLNPAFTVEDHEPQLPLAVRRAHGEAKAAGRAHAS